MIAALKRRFSWMMFVPLFPASVLLSVSLFGAPTVQVRLEVSPKSVYIGDPVEYQATVVFSSSVIAKPLAVPTTLGEFEVIDYNTQNPKSPSPDKLAVVHKFVLTTFSTGTQMIPPLILFFQTADGSLAEAKTEEVTITVKSLLQEKGDLGGLQPLKGPFALKSYRWLILVLAGALLIGLIAWLIVLFRRRKKHLAGPSRPKRPPEEVAWEQIQRLEKSDLRSNGQVKEFYFQLSVILRQYLEDRFQFSALDRTSTELLQELRRLQWNFELFNTAREFIENSDLVKFAKFTPSDDEIDADLHRARKIIDLTIPKAEVKQSDALPI